MEYIENKFYQDGKEIPVEFGNRAQIKLLNERNAIEQLLKGEGILILPERDADKEGWTEIRNNDCFCGVVTSLQANVLMADIGWRYTCDCKRNYIFRQYVDEMGVLGEMYVLKYEKSSK